MTMTRAVTKPIPARLSVGAGQSLFVVARFCYSEADPFAVALVFPDHPVWRFSRDLLLSGMTGGAGEGWFLICPTGMEVEVIHRTDGPGICLAMPFDRVHDFVTESRRIVEQGDEHVDFDPFLQSLGVGT